MCSCVYGCIYVGGMYIHLCKNICGGQGTTLSVIFSNAICIFEMGSLIGLELSNWVRIADQQGILLLLPVHGWGHKLIPACLEFYMNSGY